MEFNPPSAGPTYIQGPNMAITVPANILSPGGAKPSAGMVMETTESDIS